MATQAKNKRSETQERGSRTKSTAKSSTSVKANNTSKRGFASMDEKKQREIASKGGEAVSRNRQHMAEIGRKGGEAVSRNREHMAEIGQKGGEARNRNRGEA